MSAATATEWLTAAAIGTSTLPLLAAAVHYADHDLPHLPVDQAAAAADRATQWVRHQLAALLLLAAWHLQSREATR